MRISREAIVRMLRERGLDDRATEADERLPTVVETENDLGLLSEFGVAADDLAGGLGEVATDDKDLAADDDASGSDSAQTAQGRGELTEDQREAAGDEQERA